MQDQWELHDGKAAVGPLNEEHVIRMIRHGIPAETVCRRVGEPEWRSLRSHAPFAVACAQGAAATTTTPGPTSPAPQPAAKRKPWIALAVGLVLVGSLVKVRAYHAARAEEEEVSRREHERLASEQTRQRSVRALVPSLRKMVTASRFEGLDGQCTGKGAPPHGWVYQGARYEENGAVAEADGCEPFSPRNNITNFFCCPKQ